MRGAGEKGRKCGYFGAHETDGRENGQDPCPAAGNPKEMIKHRKHRDNCPGVFCRRLAYISISQAKPVMLHQ